MRTAPAGANLSVARLLLLPRCCAGNELHEALSRRMPPVVELHVAPGVRSGAALEVEVTGVLHSFVQPACPLNGVPMLQSES